MPINYELLDLVVQKAEEEPRRFNMDTWYGNASGLVLGGLDLEDIEGHGSLQSADGSPIFKTMKEVPPCGVVGCIAGNAAIYSGLAEPLGKPRKGPDGVMVQEYIAPSGGWFYAGKEALGLTQDEAVRLFYPYPGFHENYPEDGWPEPFASQYKAARTPKQRVAALKARVAHFKETNGKE